MQDFERILSLHHEVMALRNKQFQIHEQIYQTGTRIPIHFAFGHEAIAVALASNLPSKDKLLLPHRNIHYHLALGAAVDDLLAEYQIKTSSISGRYLGSMNLDFPNRGAIYTSNILGNNLSVATGIALGMKVKELKSAIWCVTGDGAIEEGSFFESLLLSSSKKLGVIYVVENNGWSLASTIEDRRIKMNLSMLAQSLGVRYQKLSGNNVHEYADTLYEIRETNLRTRDTFIVEVELTTLGGYFKSEGDHKRYINYHAGKAQKDAISGSVIESDSNDPVFISKKVHAEVKAELNIK
jgi:TPP-dependent pyruvate/acetoin dehydrogenase alpha subunit